MKKSIKNIFVSISLMALSGIGFASCESIYDDLEPCNIGARLRFVYDYNMEYANAFHNQVDCLNVYFYDEEGNFVTHQSVSNEAFKDESYRMEVDLPGGSYNIVAYGGLECDNSSFSFEKNPAEGVKYTDRVLNIKGNHISQELHPLFYGKCEIKVDDADTQYREETIYMIKDTNTIRVLMQQVDGMPVDHNDFNFELHADNAKMVHDNKVELSGKPTVFAPWVKDNENPGTNVDGTPASVAWGEFSIPRLVESSEVSNLTRTSVDEYEGPRLEITRKEDGSQVVSLPLIPYLLLCKPASTRAAAMSDQEFLDRESNYQLFFFLNKDYQWVSLQIQVQDWVVRVNNIKGSQL